MKKYLPYISGFVVILILLTLFVACTNKSLPIKTVTLTASPAMTVTISTPAEKRLPTENSDQQVVYPNTPEGVVQAFLLALQARPELAPRYLSNDLRKNLPANGALDLLGVPGVIQGVAIQSGAASLDPPEAGVEVGFQVDQTMSLRRFHLLKENENWVIDKIEKADD